LIMSDDFGSIIKLLLFLILIVGGIISDVVRKDRANKDVDDDLDKARAETPRQPDVTVTPPPKKKAAVAPRPVKSNSRADDPEWIATLADRKRKEAAKAAEATAKASETFEPDITDILMSRLRDPEQPITLSAQQVREGIILAEILGPPVSMK